METCNTKRRNNNPNAACRLRTTCATKPAGGLECATTPGAFPAESKSRISLEIGVDFLSEVDPAPRTSDPFDEPSARMKCHWRAFFELSEPSAESLRQVAKRRKSPWNAEQKSGSPEYVKVNIKWSHDPSVQNPPSRRLNHLRHHLRNFMNAYFQIHNDKFPRRVTDKHTKRKSPRRIGRRAGTILSRNGVSALIGRREPERRRNFHQPMLMRNWLTNQILLLRHLQLQPATPRTRKRP